MHPNIFILFSFFYYPKKHWLSNGIVKSHSNSGSNTKVSISEASKQPAFFAWIPHTDPFSNPSTQYKGFFPCFASRPRCLLCDHQKWFKLWWAASAIDLSCRSPVAHGYFCYLSCTISHTPCFRLLTGMWFLCHPWLAVRCRSWNRRKHRQQKSAVFPYPQPYHVPPVLSALCPFPLKV